jgi:RNA polymerase sigma factor (sigma-70 family)
MDRALFHELLKTHRDRVFSHSFYVLHNREDAEDVTQEVFVKLWERGGEIDSEKAAAWIMRVAHNACIDCCRRRSRKRKRESAAGAETLEAAPSQGDPGELVERTETRRLLISAMDALPASVRSLLLMHYFQDLPMDRIGGMTGMTPNAVKVAVHRGRKLLRKVFLEKVPDWCENPDRAMKKRESP